MQLATSEIKAIYQELKGVLDSIKDITSDSGWFDDEGFTEHVNAIIERVPTACTGIEDIANYLIKAQHREGGRRGAIVYVIPTRTQITTIIGRMRGLYNLEDGTKESNLVTVMQSQTQAQNQTMSVVLSLQEQILKNIDNYESGTKERTFLEKLKKQLPTFADVMSIMSAVLTIGQESGLDIETVKDLLGL